MNDQQRREIQALADYWDTHKGQGKSLFMAGAEAFDKLVTAERDRALARVEKLETVLKHCQPIIEKHSFGFDGHALAAMVSNALVDEEEIG